MFKIFDQDMFGEFLIVDDGGRLAHHEVAEDFFVFEPLALCQSQVGPPETLATHQDFLGVRTPKREGWLVMRNALLCKEVKFSGTNPV